MINDTKIQKPKILLKNSSGVIGPKHSTLLFVCEKGWEDGRVDCGFKNETTIKLLRVIGSGSERQIQRAKSVFGRKAEF